MTRTKTCASVLIAVAALGLARAAGAQSSLGVDNGIVAREGYGFYWETRLEPAVPALTSSFGTGTADASGVIHRVMLDGARRVYFGYDVIVLPLKGLNEYRLTVQPLTLTPQLASRLLGEDHAKWTFLAAPLMETPGGSVKAKTMSMDINGGDVLALTLLKNEATGQRIIDYVTVQERERWEGFRGFESVPRREFSFASGTPRDFRVEDAELHIREPRVSINGQLQESSIDSRADEAGVIVWLYVPKRGRFLLSLTPGEKSGFKKAGEVRGTTLKFTVGGTVYSLVSGSRIAPGQAAFNLYVLHEPAWVPTYPNANLSAFILGTGR
jgi:hypothetical protein